MLFNETKNCTVFNKNTKYVYMNFMLSVGILKHKIILLCLQGNFNKIFKMYSLNYYRIPIMHWSRILSIFLPSAHWKHVPKLFP